MAVPYPFSAIVGQEQMKQALLAAAVDASIGGVLIYGDRGTGKSTAVRGLAALLPTIRVVKGCPYNCDPSLVERNCELCREGRDDAGSGLPVARRPVPVVDLPLGATEDRVVGALDLERALTQGEKAFEPGLLAAANRGFLYIDEVNLLEDHLVDLLLDVAASGENLVEREGLSVRHAARFVLIGSGNPEEGELRPQLLDRFGLCVDVGTPEAVADRVAVIRRRDEFERDPGAFLESWKNRETALRRRVSAARKRLPSVTTPDEVLERIAALCQALGTDGLRGELTLLRAARAVAALAGASELALSHVREVAPAALGHRLRRDPLDDSRASARVTRAVDEVLAA